MKQHAYPCSGSLHMLLPLVGTFLPLAPTHLFFFFLNIYLFIYLSVLGLSCGMRALLVAACGIEPGPPALGAWSLNHWTTREVPYSSLRSQLKCHFLAEVFPDSQSFCPPLFWNSVPFLQSTSFINYVFVGAIM